MRENLVKEREREISNTLLIVVILISDQSSQHLLFAIPWPNSKNWMYIRCALFVARDSHKKDFAFWKEREREKEKRFCFLKLH